MIYTVTLNPSLDYIVTTDELKNGMTNRTVSEKIVAGGKGINVSTVLARFKVESHAIYFASGFVGDEITKRVGELGVSAEKIDACGCSRINVKVNDALNSECTEINGMGPIIDKKKLDELGEKLKSLKNGDFLVLSGSIPGHVSTYLYADICKMLEDRDVKIIVDSTGEKLMACLKYSPFLIKPNRDELVEIFGDVTEEDDIYIRRCAKKLNDLGAKNVLVSLGKDGAYFLAESGEEYFHEAYKGDVINTVGAGDSMIAGFLKEYTESGNYEKAFETAVTFGCAAAFSEHLATPEIVEKLSD